MDKANGRGRPSKKIEDKKTESLIIKLELDEKKHSKRQQKFLVLLFQFGQDKD